MKKYLTLAFLASGVFALNLDAQSLGLVITNGLFEASGVAVDATNNYFVTDSGNNRIVKYNPVTGAITQLAGTWNFAPGTNDGAGILASFLNPQGIVFSAARGGFVVSDSGNHTLRLVTLAGTVSTLAGQPGAPGYSDNAIGTLAQFDDPAGLAIDNTTGNIYIADLINGVIRMLSPANNVTTVATGGTKFNRPSAVAFDSASGNLYVADTWNNAIAVVAGGAVTRIAGSGSPNVSGATDSPLGTSALFFHPRGLLWVGGATGLLVSDTDNGLIRRVYSNPILPGNYSTATYVTNNATGAPLLKPTGLAEDNNGIFLVADQGTDATGPSKVWSIMVGQALPPVSAPQIGALTLTNDIGSGLVTLQFNQIAGTATFNNDRVIGILTTDSNPGVQTFYTLGPTTNVPPPPTQVQGSVPPGFNLTDKSLPPTIVNPTQPDLTIQAYSTAQGRVASPVVTARIQFQCAAPTINGIDPSSFTLTEITTNAQLWYTTDGSIPTNQPPSQLYGGGPLNVVNGTNDVVFNVVAFKSGYSESGEVSQTFHFSDIQNSFLGFTHGFNAGIGATLVVPVQVKLNSTNVLKSLQFRIEVTPAAGTPPPISTQMRNIVITTNDFVQITPPATNAPVSSTYQNGPTTGVSIAYLGQNTGFNAAGSMTVALVAIPIPGTAAAGNTYTLACVQPSGTSDGVQTAVAMAPFANQSITITNIPYTVGDSAPGNFYNAGDFGNGNLNNNDVNNALAASLGLRVPYTFSDAFDAMDAFPVDTTTSVGGDGQIRYLDWQVILNRSLRLDTNDWIRMWSAGGVRVNAHTNLNSAPDLPAQSSSADAGSGLITLNGVKLQNVNAQVGVVPQGNVNPGTVANVPVYVNVTPGSSLAGLQFLATVQPAGGAPALTQPVQFVPATGVPAPIAPALSANQAGGGWPALTTTNSFAAPLTGSNLLGVVSIPIPSTAQAGQAYVVAIVNADGAPNLTTQYNFAVSSGSVAVQAPALQPTLPAVSGFKLDWFGDAGQIYTIESSSDLLNWSVVGQNLHGQGATMEFTDPNASDGNRFYRVHTQAP
ncbi:MAG: chitobiase/beta-hexosaminidase C-terminal domain-containing protein [Verrucomicrobia bacterium]|nr:chitobiase/beta-hexosaminidase C-terminal domain-containing protein [Verrucomicrobiota bacterium]